MKKNIKNYIFLHSILLLYSLVGIFSKLASSKPFLSFAFIFFYGAVIIILLVYAVLWQQILKKMNLTTAYANKSIVVIWGMFWGYLFFQEKLTTFMWIGAFMIFIGVYLVVTNYE